MVVRYLTQQAQRNKERASDLAQEAGYRRMTCDSRCQSVVPIERTLAFRRRLRESVFFTFENTCSHRIIHRSLELAFEKSQTSKSAMHLLLLKLSVILSSKNKLFFIYTIRPGPNAYHFFLNFLNKILIK